MPSTLCLEPRCPNPATYRGRCQRHQRERNRETSPNKTLYNTKRWKILRRTKLSKSPICERCDKRLATEVHHRLAIRVGGEPWAMSNLESLCKPCHSHETRQEQMGTR